MPHDMFDLHIWPPIAVYPRCGEQSKHALYCAGRQRTVCRITNTKNEIYDDPKDDPLNPQSEYIEVENIPVFDPEKGDLSQRVSRTFLDELGNEEISVEETGYWFTEPPGGWESYNRTMKRAIPTEANFANPEHQDKSNRFQLQELQENEVLVGIVTDIWLYHGAQVDLMCEFDGLIPITAEEWRDVEDKLLPGDEVKIRVHKLRQPGLYRWPIQLEILDPEIAPFITSPHDWSCPCNLGWAFDQGWDLQQVSAAINRPYTQAKYFLERDHSDAMEEIKHAYGWDEPDVDGHEEDWLTRELDDATLHQIQDIATSSLMGM
eukprot:jgi/Chrzof1/2903/Cz12g03120.t1